MALGGDWTAEAGHRGHTPARRTGNGDENSPAPNGVFRYAQAKGLCRDNPAVSARKLLPRKKDTGRMAALLDRTALGDVLRRAETARLAASVRMAHRLCAFTASRIGNVVNTECREFRLDDEQPVWIIPRAKTKFAIREIDHGVPLRLETTAEMPQWRAVSVGSGIVCPSPTGGRYPEHRAKRFRRHRTRLKSSPLESVRYRGLNAPPRAPHYPDYPCCGGARTPGCLAPETCIGLHLQG